MTDHSITHHQILLVLNSELKGRSDVSRVRILDMGCGDGRLIAFLHEWLSRYNPEIQIELYGFDVSDIGVQSSGFLGQTIARLAATFPNEEWDKRVLLLESKDRWPYADGFFDYIYSNQVMEHVLDHAHVFSEMKRVLARTGRAVHLFPLVHYWFEGHLRLPFVHWIHNHDLLFTYIKAASIFGFGKFRAQKKVDKKITLDLFSEEHADYMNAFTNYLTKDELLRLAKRAGFRCSFRYTEWFYINKLRTLIGLYPRHLADMRRTGFFHSVLLQLLMRVSSITAFLEKEQIYRRQ